MADKKISELTELTTPDGTEELVVNDSGVSKKVQIDNLLAGSTISNFTSTGIDDNATSTAITIDASENVSLVGTLTGTVLNDSDGNVRSGRKNLIINGGFDVWQRGTSFTSTSVNEYSADRFRTEGYGLSTTISRQSFTAGQTDVPNFPTYFCRVATSTVSAGQFWGLQQRIETPQVMSYGQTVTVSFWVKATTGTLASGAFTYGLDSSKSSSPALTTTWQKITNTFTCGLSGNYSSFYPVYLGAGSAAISVDIAQVQLELGSVATDFEHRSYGEELALCQRYFTRSKNFIGMCNNAGNGVEGYIWFDVEMRTAPSLAQDSPFSINDVANNYTQSGNNIIIYSPTTRGAFVTMANFTGLTAFRPCASRGLGGDILADAEL